MNETLTRFLSGVVYVALLLFATSYSELSFFSLFGAFLLIAIYEYGQLMQLNKIASIVIGGACYFAIVYFRTPKINQSLSTFIKPITDQNSDLKFLGRIEIYILLIAIFTSIKALFLLFNTHKNTLGTGNKYLYLLGYIILPFIIITQIPYGIKGYNPKIIISIFILIWTNDTFAYIVGKSIGKHKLLETISPKKTIEGFIGGVVFSVVAGYLISRFYFDPNPKHIERSIFIWTISALIISIFSTLGDLIESKFKRMAGVKDSGKIMPGHGGILDRLDSIIFVAPFVFLFYQILYYVS